MPEWDPRSVARSLVTALGALAVLVVTGALAGCAAEPAPTPPLPSCLPRYSDPQWILRLEHSGGPSKYGPWLTAGDLDGNGLDDVIITPGHGTTEPPPTAEIRVLLNDGTGGLVLATRPMFSGPIPRTQNPAAAVVVAELNGDGRSDIFVNDIGMDANAFPGHQNILLLSARGDTLVDATDTLPQLDDVARHASAADIDGDGDTDLFVGTMPGQAMIDPYILLNDGIGTFALAENRLPQSLHLDQNRYSASEFVDVNNDGAPDLVLGAAGHELDKEFSSPDSIVLLNDGSGSFGLPPLALPPKPFTPFDVALDIHPLDLNHDGYPDLLVAYTKQLSRTYTGRYIQVLVNNQDGTFTDETPTRLQQSDNNDAHVYQLEMRDIDQDQDLDLIARPWDPVDPNPLLYLNDGSGTFAQEKLDFQVEYLNYAFLDLEGDGGHDIVNARDWPPEDYFLIRDLGCTEPLF
jgi:hypothetical protein